MQIIDRVFYLCGARKGLLVTACVRAASLGCVLRARARCLFLSLLWAAQKTSDFLAPDLTHDARVRACVRATASERERETERGSDILAPI